MSLVANAINGGTQLALAILPAVDTPVDLTDQATQTGVIMGGVGAALVATVAGALALRGTKWGIPQIVNFFTKLVGR